MAFLVGTKFYPELINLQSLSTQDKTNIKPYWIMLVFLLFQPWSSTNQHSILIKITIIFKKQQQQLYLIKYESTQNNNNPTRKTFYILDSGLLIL